MPVITYTATRSLRGGVSVGDTEQIELEFQRRTRTHRKEGYNQQSIAGRTAAYLDRIEYERDILTDLLSVSSALAQWQEFIDSVINQESFYIDFTGTIASPGTDVLVELVSDSIREDQVRGLYFTVAFLVREL